PARGRRVVGMVGRGAWAELARVPTDTLCELPDGVGDAQAATLPVAGLTALKALDIAGCVLGRRVLLTRAGGGGGRFAGGPAERAGAHVRAVWANAQRAGGLRELGAAEVIHHLDPAGEEFDAVFEGVGGATLGAALQRVAAGGTVVSFAASDPAPVSFPTR